MLVELQFVHCSEGWQADSHAACKDKLASRCFDHVQYCEGWEADSPTACNLQRSRSLNAKSMSTTLQGCIAVKQASFNRWVAHVKNTSTTLQLCSFQLLVPPYGFKRWLRVYKKLLKLSLHEAAETASTKYGSAASSADVQEEWRNKANFQQLSTQTFLQAHLGYIDNWVTLAEHIHESRSSLLYTEESPWVVKFSGGTAKCCSTLPPSTESLHHRPVKAVGLIKCFEGTKLPAIAVVHGSSKNSFCSFQFPVLPWLERWLWVCVKLLVNWFSLFTRASNKFGSAGSATGIQDQWHSKANFQQFSTELFLLRLQLHF